jgi:hypothetical protein
MGIFLMRKVILIHANCHNSKAKGDFSFAGSIASDMMNVLRAKCIDDIDVILVSTLDSISKFVSLYGDPVDGRIEVDGTSIGLSSLELLDPIANNTIAFIDANRCKHSPGELVKRVLSPETKFLFVGNSNQNPFSGLFLKTLYYKQLLIDQPGVYEHFDESDLLIGSAGMGSERLGLPSIKKAADLPKLTVGKSAIIPGSTYGFLYVNALDPSKDYKLIAQYIKLTGFDQYCLVGNFTTKKTQIEEAYALDITMPGKSTLPTIHYHQFLPNAEMRQVVANSTGSLVVSTGISSTLEAMQDKKLPFYQNLDSNKQFIESYLIAVQSMVLNDETLIGALPNMIIELSQLLFASKPLSKGEMERTDTLLNMSVVQSRLVNTNQELIARASGKIAPKLLSFIGSTRYTNDKIQLATVCASLRKPGEMGSPVHGQALRRAACWGRLFELKVVIKSMAPSDLNNKDSVTKRTALHWAALTKNHDCARALIEANCSVDVQDKDDRTPLHFAVSSGDRTMIKLLIDAGASLNIPDKASQTPKDCAHDSGVLLYIAQCHHEIGAVQNLG